MRILIYATAPWAQSGYATVARNVGPILREMGHDVAFHAWNTIRSGIMAYEGMPVYPAGQTITSHDILAGVIKHFNADVLLTVCDPWIAEDPELWQKHHNAKVIHWHPCQTSPCGKRLADHVRAAHLGLNYSQWGTQQVLQAGVNNVRYVPLGVNTNTFFPLAPGAARRWLSDKLGVDLTDRYLIAIIAANASTEPIMRKNFDGQLCAFKIFQREVKNAALYIHTNYLGIPDGVDLRPMIEHLGLTIGQDVFFPSYWNYVVGLDDAWLNRMLNACDMVSAASLGEGFGLPILEAQAVGLPVVATDASSMPELTHFGYLARVAVRQWCPGYLDGFVFMPDTDDIAEGYMALYENRAPIGSREEALSFARTMRWENIVRNYLEPVLRESVQG